jgi:hypothetical protein
MILDNGDVLAATEVSPWWTPFNEQQAEVRTGLSFYFLTQAGRLRGDFTETVCRN